MLIQFGKVRLLNGQPWAAVELTSESRTEEVVMHLTRWAHDHLQGHPFQMLFPVKSRGVEGVQMLSPYLWARSTQNLLGMASGWGVEGLVTDGKGQILLTDDSFVQELIEKTRAAAEAWSAGITIGSHVRVLMGSQRMLCGRVEKIVRNRAEVLIAMRSNSMRLRIGLLALENLGMEPKEYFHKESQ
jgi:hypothetical protein